MPSLPFTASSVSGYMSSQLLVLEESEQSLSHRLTRTMVKDGRCRWAGSFLLSPTLLGLGSGRFLCRWVTSCLGLLGFLAGFATTLGASAAVVQIATGAPLAGLLVRPAFATLILLVLLTVPHRSGTGWTPEVNTRGKKRAVGKAPL